MGEVILIVDDEPDIRKSLSDLLSDEGYEVVTASTCSEAEVAVARKSPEVILLDIWLPDGDGMDVLKKIREKNHDSQVIMISGHGTIETAVKAIKSGAHDFLEKPLSIEKTLVTVKRAMELKRVKEENLVLKEQIESDLTLIGAGRLMEEVRKKIEIFSQSSSPVLISGESGTGKEVVARIIHNKSPRSKRAFIPVNCAAIPEELIESELFGYEKGAFTGATGRKKGKFDIADKGVLFLDEIGDMTLKTQAKILRILQEQSFERVGGTEQIRVDVRIIAATNKNLEEEIRNERFRKDLYFRLKVLPIELPPLRERVEDINLLVGHFLQQFCRIYRKPAKHVASQAMDAMMKYKWPGNVRELKNIVERLVIMSDDITIEMDDLPEEFRTGTDTGAKEHIYGGSLESARAEFEKDYIMKKLAEHGGNITRTADVLEISRENLSRKIKQLGIRLKKEV